MTGRQPTPPQNEGHEALGLGWKVHAVDSEPEALARLAEQMPAAPRSSDADARKVRIIAATRGRSYQRQIFLTILSTRAVCVALEVAIRRTPLWRNIRWTAVRRPGQSGEKLLHDLS